MSTDGLLLSVCVMTYNRVETLEDSLHSLLPDIEADPRAEIVICDNASSDGTREYCARFVAEHPCVRYHRNTENGGFDGNVVTCIAQAHGQFLTFFSDDDVALPGTFTRVLQELQETTPTVLYLNHYAFKGTDPRDGDLCKMPVRDEIFTDGRMFFQFAGLGFLSALTVNTAAARKYVTAAKMGPGQAHLDVVSRVCFFEPGPFLFLGSVAVPARVSVAWDDGWLRAGALEETRFYQGLADDGLLDSSIVHRRVRLTIIRNLFGLVVANKCLGDNQALKALRGNLVQVYGRYWQFWVLVAPALVIPRAVLRPPYLLARFCLRPFRQLRFR